MNQRRRWLLHLATALSLLLSAASIILWIRSYRVQTYLVEADRFTITHHDPQYWFISRPGKLAFCRQVGVNWGIPLKEFNFIGIHFGGGSGPGGLLWNLQIPYWMIAALALVLPVVRSVSVFRNWMRSRHQPGHCRNCGYDLRATPHRCPECGTENSESIAPGEASSI